jgi:DNA-binding NarL/FixJ family response regulator
MKIILDLARQGKTASQIAEESGYNRNRVLQVVRNFTEYGAKLKPEPKKIKAKNPDPGQYRSKWTPEETEILMNMREAGCTWAEIGEKLGRTNNACSMRWGRENERRINHSNVFRSVDSGR